MTVSKPGEREVDALLAPSTRHGTSRGSLATVWPLLAVVGALIVLATLIWQGIAAHGSPDPTQAHLNPGAVLLDTAILVFREGLEAVLVLAALTASLVRTQDGYWRPIAVGSALSLLATAATWFLVVALLSDINAPELDIQAATGLLAIIVLLVVMNWFFHKLYWTGWISLHTRRKRALTGSPGTTRMTMYRGLLLLGFTSVYREGFEVVLFLQNLRLRAGSAIVLEGALIGVALATMVAVVVFVLHYRLPYRRMLVLTGVMLGAVLVVMVGESVQEMQQAHWISATWLHLVMPGWLNTWFAVFPTAESMGAQVVAAAVVLGSYAYVNRARRVGAVA